MSDLVIVEWYIYDRIPYTRHAIVVTRRQAREWQKQGAVMRAHDIDPEVRREIRYEPQTRR